MNITVRWVHRLSTNKPYADVAVQTDSTRTELGLLDAKERQVLAEHLRKVADELSPEEEEE